MFNFKRKIRQTVFYFLCLSTGRGENSDFLNASFAAVDFFPPQKYTDPFTDMRYGFLAASALNDSDGISTGAAMDESLRTLKPGASGDAVNSSKTYPSSPGNIA